MPNFNAYIKPVCFISLFILLLLTKSKAQQGISPIYNEVTTAAVYKGASLENDIKQNLLYPAIATEYKIDANFYASCVILKDGNIGPVQIVQYEGFEKYKTLIEKDKLITIIRHMEYETIQCVKRLKTWTPATFKKNNVHSTQVIKIIFNPTLIK